MRKLTFLIEGVIEKSVDEAYSHHVRTTIQRTGFVKPISKQEFYSKLLFIGATQELKGDKNKPSLSEVLDKSKGPNTI